VPGLLQEQRWGTRHLVDLWTAVAIGGQPVAAMAPVVVVVVMAHLIGEKATRDDLENLCLRYVGAGAAQGENWCERKAPAKDLGGCP